MLSTIVAKYNEIQLTGIKLFMIKGTFPLRTAFNEQLYLFILRKKNLSLYIFFYFKPKSTVLYILTL